MWRLIILFSLLTLSLVVSRVAVVAQDDCPDEVSDCSGVCEGAQCARFLNAECRENPCHGLCSPNFFWRGRNVTNRCDIERCSDIKCPGLRDCVEEEVELSCPQGTPFCRRYIRTRCVLPSPPTDCSQITCGPGEFCRKSLRGKGKRCVQARKCSQLDCDEGYTCAETDEGPRCNANRPASSCEEAACPENKVCSVFSVPSRDISIAQCISQTEANRKPVYSPDFSCETLACEENEVCTDVFEERRFLISDCQVIDCDTSDPSTCATNRVCIDIPPNFVEFLQIPFATSCVPPGFAYGGNCTTLNPCPPGLACHDVVFEGTTIGPACGISAETYSGFTCKELGCPAPLECLETVVEGRGSLALCLPEASLTLRLESIFADDRQ